MTNDDTRIGAQLQQARSALREALAREVRKWIIETGLVTRVQVHIHVEGRSITLEVRADEGDPDVAAGDTWGLEHGPSTLGDLNDD